MCTDKSGKLACESCDQYVASMEPHVANDPVISLEEKNVIENTLNGHSLQLARILKIGQNGNDWNRVKSALNNKFGHVPVLYGLKKDHKTRAAGQPVPTCPVCGANDAPNAQQSFQCRQKWWHTGGSEERGGTCAPKSCDV